MRKRKFGKIINIITSYVMDVPPTGFSVYTATKAYIRQYNPKSTYLQQFVKQSCKTAGERWIGLKKKRGTTHQ